MSNTKDVRITADVPFNFLDEESGGEGMSHNDIAAVAILLSPTIGLRYTYTDLGYVPNGHGQTAMYRLEISGVEALSTVFLQRLARILKNCSPLAKLHIAEAQDLDNHGEPWFHLVNKSELSGEFNRV